MVQALSPPQGHQQQQQRDWLREDRHSQDGSGMPGGSAGDIRVQAGAAGHVAGATVGGASSSGAALSASLPIHAAVISQGCLTGSKSGDVLLQLLSLPHLVALPAQPAAAAASEGSRRSAESERREGQSTRAARTAGADLVRGKRGAERGQRNETVETSEQLGAIRGGEQGSDRATEAFGRVSVTTSRGTQQDWDGTDKKARAAGNDCTSSCVDRLGWSWRRAEEPAGEGETAGGWERGRTARDLSYRGSAALADVHSWLGGRGGGEAGTGGQRLECHRGSVTGIGLWWHQESSDVLAVSVGADGWVKVRGGLAGTQPRLGGACGTMGRSHGGLSSCAAILVWEPIASTSSAPLPLPPLLSSPLFASPLLCLSSPLLLCFSHCFSSAARRHLRGPSAGPLAPLVPLGSDLAGTHPPCRTTAVSCE